VSVTAVEINNEERDDEVTPKGRVFLVGAGPGDPGLITVRGRQLLESAEVVIYDYLANRQLLRYVPAAAERIYAGKRGDGQHTHSQEEINNLLVDRALAGRTVVRLKGGDPFIFGRGGEEIEALARENILFEVVPGVTSASAAATYAGIPITHRAFTSSVAFITGHEDPTKENSHIAWDKLATGVGTIVIYMGIKNLDSIAGNLIRHGRAPETPVAVVRWASTPEQRTVTGTLATIAEIVRDTSLKPPAIVVVGEVVHLRDTINWFEKRPLFGKRLLVTRTREQASDLVVRLEGLGAQCLEYATIRIEPPPSLEEADREIGRLDRYDWLLFTSVNAVTFFFDRLFHQGLDVRALGSAAIGVVGKATAEALRSYGLKADLMPADFTGDGLAEALVRQGVSGRKILIPRALHARESLPEILRRAGAEVTVAPVYHNVLPTEFDGVEARAALRAEFEEKRIDMVTFTSSSTVANFVKLLDLDGPAEVAELLRGVAVAAIGPITGETARKLGLTVHVQPESHTIPALVRAINAYFRK